MPKPKAATLPSKPPKPLSVRNEAATAVKGGRRTTVKDANDKYANG